MWSISILATGGTIMSVDIATGGMFRSCCGGGGTGFGGGAPPVMQLAEKQKFAVTVDKVYFRDVKKKDKELKILVKDITIGDY
jgi:hypothetical protein